MQYSIIQKWTQISCKYMSRTLGQPLSRKITKAYMLRKEKKWNYIKCSINTTKGKKRLEGKYMKQEQVQQIEN